MWTSLEIKKRTSQQQRNTSEDADILDVTVVNMVSRPEYYWNIPFQQLHQQCITIQRNKIQNMNFTRE